MAVTEIQSKAEFDQFLKSHKIVIIDAFATWCGPCKAISPFFEKYANEFEYDKDNVAFIKFDTDEVPDLAQELGVRSVPAFYVFKDGEKADNLSGANPPGLKKLVEISIDGINGD